MTKGSLAGRWGIHTIYMQDVEQGEPQSQVLFRVTFLQCITLARQTLHHKSATYQQRHHEAARLLDLRRGGRLRGPPALPRGLPAGSAPESRPRPAPDDGGGTALEETSVMPAVAAVRGITPVEPLPSLILLYNLYWEIEVDH